MKKILICWRRQESLSSSSSSSSGSSRVGDRGPGYHIRGKDLGQIHKAASVGNVAKVRQILLLQINGLNDRDKKNRTALHLACANGHPEVVTLLAEQNCMLNLCDKENRTALLKALQCQQEECAAVLLARGADPNVVDIDGNTALHYAVLGQNAAIVAKLLSCSAHMEARNKDGFTPLSIAKRQNKQQMVELLINNGAKFDLMDRPTSDGEGFKVEEEKETQKMSEMKVTKDMHKVAGDDSHGLIKQRVCKQADDQQFPIMKNSDADRYSKQISYEEYKVKEKINSMDDLDDLIHSTETVSEPCQSPYSKCKNFTLLIKQPCKHCKDSDSLHKIQDAVLVSERAMELGEKQCELHTQKVKTMENGVSGLHKKSSETGEIESLSEHQKVKWERELCDLRFALKEEKEKRQRADLLYEKSREQLMKIEEQYAKETEMNRELETTVRTLEMELKSVRQSLCQVVEEQNETQRQLYQEQYTRKLQEKNLTNLLGEENELEIAYKKMKSENDDLTAKLKAAYSECQLLHENNKCLQRELLFMKTTDKQREKLEDENEKLKQEVMNLKRHMEMNMVEFSEVKQYKLKTEEQARQQVAEKLKQVHLVLEIQGVSQEFNSIMRRNLECQNKHLKSELSKMQTFPNCNKIELEHYKRLNLEELEYRKSLENKLNKTMERLTEVHGKYRLQKQHCHDLLSTVHRRPVQQTLYVVNTSNRFVLSVPSTSRRT